MKNLKYSILLIIIGLFLVSTDVYSQRCKGFHLHADCWTNDIKKDYKQYGQARSALLEINKKFTYQAIFYGKKDYKLLVCTEYSYDSVHFRLTDAKTKEVFYDNAEDDYLEYVGFTTDENLALIIEITVLAEDIEPEDGRDLRVCTGIQIIWRKAPKLGF